MGVRASGRLCQLRASGRLGVWAFGRLSVGRTPSELVWHVLVIFISWALGTWAFGCSGVWAFGRLSVRALGRLGGRASGRLGVSRSVGCTHRLVYIWLCQPRASGRLGVWAFGRLGVWAFGRVGVWTFGRS